MTCSGEIIHPIPMTESNDIPVFVATTVTTDTTFHTAATCTQLSSSRTTVSRSTAERGGRTECRLCFERRIERLKDEYVAPVETTRGQYV
jgi:hypothetical protein